MWNFWREIFEFWSAGGVLRIPNNFIIYSDKELKFLGSFFSTHKKCWSSEGKAETGGRSSFVLVAWVRSIVYGIFFKFSMMVCGVLGVLLLKKKRFSNFWWQIFDVWGEGSSQGSRSSGDFF